MELIPTLFFNSLKWSKTTTWNNSNVERVLWFDEKLFKRAWKKTDYRLCKFILFKDIEAKIKVYANLSMVYARLNENKG